MTQTPICRSATHGLSSWTHSSIQTLTVTISLVLMLVVLWALSHHYQGFARDGELYAVQALARLHSDLRTDIYLANDSQDGYTIFSRIYVFFIDTLGLRNAATLLFALCTVWFLSAAWALARQVSNRDQAWLSVIMFMVTTGTYGASGVFHYSESYLTARSLAEALVITALVAHFHGSKRVALFIAVAALFVHPLMALPGLLLLTCLWLRIRHAILGAVAGILIAFAIAATASLNPESGPLTVMDASWLDVVRERSQFVFLKYWGPDDWENHARPLLCLMLSAWVFDEPRIRRLCAAAMLVGVAGLAVAFIAGAIGPVAILLQGQAWRWFWVTTFISVLLLAPTAVHLWREEKCGAICATLIISGWTFAAVDGAALIALAFLLWSLRSRIERRAGEFLRWAAYALIAIIVMWALANCWSLITSPRTETGPESLFFDRIRSILGLQVSTVLFFGCFWYWIRSSRLVWAPAAVAVLLAGSLTLILPNSFNWTDMAGSNSQIEEFSDWRGAIPGASNVLVVPARKSASFVWFTLERPSYLTIDQSSGVIFSRATALEVRRRSEVLLPIAKPDWQLLSQITQEAQGKKLENMTRPLTSKSLVAICSDSQLGFVVAKERVGFDPIRHSHVGPWKDWNLYDCRRVRSAGA